MEGKEEETEIWDGCGQGEFYYQPAGMLRDIPAFATDLLSAQTQKQGCGKGLAWAIRMFPGLGKILTFLPGRWIAGFCLEEVGMMLVVVI